MIARRYSSVSIVYLFAFFLEENCVVQSVGHDSIWKLLTKCSYNF